MNIREQIKKDFGVDLPIKGGTGNSIDSPVILIYNPGDNDFISIEYAYLKFISIGRGIEWNVLGQELIIRDDRKFDKIKIETKEITETEIITQIENYYFDITECFNK